MNLPPGITIDAPHRSGKPRVRDTRITVVDVLEYLAGGMTVAQVLADFPELTEADVWACLAVAVEAVKAQFPGRG